VLAGISAVGPAVVYVAVIFVEGSLSGGETYVTMTDKQLHAAAFGVMVPFLVRAIRYVRAAFGLTLQLAISAAASSGIGALLEIWQAILPHRDADVLDWVADTIGAASAASMLAILAVLFGVLGTANAD
jgi:VanZ family protein